MQSWSKFNHIFVTFICINCFPSLLRNRSKTEILRYTLLKFKLYIYLSTQNQILSKWLCRYVRWNQFTRFSQNWLNKFFPTLWFCLLKTHLHSLRWVSCQNVLNAILYPILNATNKTIKTILSRSVPKLTQILTG